MFPFLQKLFTRQPMSVDICQNFIKPPLPFEDFVRCDAYQGPDKQGYEAIKRIVKSEDWQYLAKDIENRAKDYLYQAWPATTPEAIQALNLCGTTLLSLLNTLNSYKDIVETKEDQDTWAA